MRSHSSAFACFWVYGNYSGQQNFKNEEEDDNESDDLGNILLIPTLNFKRIHLLISQLNNSWYVDDYEPESMLFDYHSIKQSPNFLVKNYDNAEYRGEVITKVVVL